MLPDTQAQTTHLPAQKPGVPSLAPIHSQGMSKSKLAKAMNKLVYAGDLAELRRVISQNRQLAQACLPFMASVSYRETVLTILAERR